MSADTDASAIDPPEVQEQARRARRAKWLWIGIAVVAPVTLLLAAIFATLAWYWADRAKATAAVKAEVARIQAAGEPITTADLYAFHRVPAGVPDLTKEWLAVLASFDEDEFGNDSGILPVVGFGSDEGLDPHSSASDLAALHNFLQKYDPTLQATLSVARKPGECRFATKFERGIAAPFSVGPEIIRVSRLLALDVRVKALDGKVEGAITSTEAMFGVPRAMEHQLTLSDQVISIATFIKAIREVEFLLNHFELTDEQIARLHAPLAAFDAQAGLALAMIGERGVWYQSIRQSELLSGEDKATPEMRADPDRIMRPADCLLYLEMMGEMIAASREPFPESEVVVANIEKRLQDLAASKNPLERYRYAATTLVVPATSKAFSKAASCVAERDTLSTALAAERYRRKTGTYPTALTQLVPEFLPAVPTDPFDGKPLRMVAGEGELTVYSIGEDHRDDGGQIPEIPSMKMDDGTIVYAQVPNPMPTLDVIVRVRAKKGQPEMP